MKCASGLSGDTANVVVPATGPVSSNLTFTAKDLPVLSQVMLRLLKKIGDVLEEEHRQKSFRDRGPAATTVDCKPTAPAELRRFESCRSHQNCRPVAELVFAAVSKAVAFGHVGSIPTGPTN